MQIDEKTGYLTLPGLRKGIRIRDGWIEGATGWRRVANAEEEAMYAALRNLCVTEGAVAPLPDAPGQEGEPPAPGEGVDRG